MIQKGLLFLIQGYRVYISPRRKPCCRFTPSCSRYAYDAILRFGAGKGSWLAVKRILRCHPFYQGGLYYDPVPEKEANA